MKTFALAFAATLANAALLTHETPEQAACRCLDVIPDLTVYEPTTNMDDDFVVVVFNGMEVQYPGNYGTGICMAWDAMLFGAGCADMEGTVLDDAPGYCAEPWCYVGNDCTLFDDVTVSSYFPQVSYSYGACGGDANAPPPAPVVPEPEAEVDPEAEDEDSGNNVNIDIEFNVNAAH